MCPIVIETNFIRSLYNLELVISDEKQSKANPCTDPDGSRSLMLSDS
jgi:hypothetical protein